MSRASSKRKSQKMRKHESSIHKMPSPHVHLHASTSEEKIVADAVERVLDEARKVLAKPESEKITSLADRLASIPEEAAIEAIHRIGHDLGEEALPLLEALAVSGERMLALAAVEALGATKTEKAVPVLTSLAEKSEDRQMHKEARRSLFKLKSAGVAVPATTKAKEEGPALAPSGITLWKAYMTNPDHHGDQIFQAGATGPFGRFDVFDIIASDTAGIKEMHVHDSSKKSWQALVEKIDELPGFTVVEIPVDYFRYRVKQAYELSKADGRTLEPSFYRWRATIAEPKEAWEQHPVYRDISIVEIKWNPELLEKSPEILRNEEFVIWLLPEEDIKGYIEELAAVKEGRVALPPWVETERAEQITARALDHFFGAEARARYKNRLEDMAYLLFHTDRLLDAKRALAAAVAFDEKTGVPSAKHPFALALFQTTVDVILEERNEARQAEQHVLITDVSELAEYIDHESE